MADDDKIIADAFHQAFKKPTKLPADLYLRMTHDLKIDENEPLKVNLTMKRGLVLDIEDDSLFRTFLGVGDIVLTINDRVASKPDFKLTDVFKDRGGKMLSFTYIRLRNYSLEEPIFEDGEKRDNCDYRVAVIYCLQRMTLGLAVEGLNNRVYITSIQPKSLGSLCAAVGDVILQVNGKRVTDTEKAMGLIADELETKSHFKITLERAKTEEARAHVQFAISKENRDPPVPVDCTQYVEKALKEMRGAEPKPILRTPRLSVADEGSRVAFHDRITTENVIPSDVADDALIKTPARVPNAPGAPQQQPSSTQPQSSEAVEKPEQSAMKALSMHESGGKKGNSKETIKSRDGRKGKGSAKKTEGGPQSKSKESVGTSSMMTSSTMTAMSPNSSSPKIGRSFREWRKRLSTEIFFGRNRKKSGGGGGGGTVEGAKNKKKKGKKDHTSTSNTSNDTEGNQ